MKKIIVSLIIIGLVIWGIVSLNKRQPPEPRQGEKEIEGLVEAPQPQTPEPITYQGKEGVDALSLLKEKVQVETQDFGDKPMVTSINGVKADEKNFWAFYVNGKMSEIGASDYKTKDSDQIEWRYQPV